MAVWLRILETRRNAGYVANSGDDALHIGGPTNALRGEIKNHFTDGCLFPSRDPSPHPVIPASVESLTNTKFRQAAPVRKTSTLSIFMKSSSSDDYMKF